MKTVTEKRKFSKTMAVEFNLATSSFIFRKVPQPRFVSMTLGTRLKVPFSGQVSTREHVNGVFKTFHDSIDRFLKSYGVFSDRFHRIRVNGRPICKEKVALSNENGFM